MSSMQIPCKLPIWEGSQNRTSGSFSALFKCPKWFSGAVQGPARFPRSNEISQVGNGEKQGRHSAGVGPAGSRKEPERQEKRRKGRQGPTKKQKSMLEGGKIQPSLGFLPHVTFCHLRSENSTLGRLSSPPQFE